MDLPPPRGKPRSDAILARRKRTDKSELNEAVIFSAEGATGLKPGVERSGTQEPI